jgi:CxxC motif-containing protein (DUF1111 family)
MKRFAVIVVLSVLVAACSKVLPGLPADDSILDGPVDGLTGEQHQAFLRGDVAFNDEVFTPASGLGPLFVATSCASCHAGDGKGHPFTMLTRFGQRDTINEFLSIGGPQLQHRAIPGFKPEIIPAGASFSKFMPPANTGLGFLDAVPDEMLIAMADENDRDGDGISGRPNWLKIPAYATPRAASIERNGRYIGRFGKKAAAYDLLQQTANAYNQDIGITSSFESYDTYSGHLTDPEISTQTVLDVVFYLKTLKAPVQRNASDPEVVSGKQLFTATGCGKCHMPQLTTGSSPIAPLSNKTFFPFTDLLLHDMGPQLDDGYTEGLASTGEWRTPALWGLGLSKRSQGGQYFLLHDGRAHTIEEAILLHGGEAAKSKSNFEQLNGEQKKQLIKFLESL